MIFTYGHLKERYKDRYLRKQTEAEQIYPSPTFSRKDQSLEDQVWQENRGGSSFQGQHALSRPLHAPQQSVFEAFWFARLLLTYILKGFSSVRQDPITLRVVYNAPSSYTIMMILIIRI